MNYGVALKRRYPPVELPPRRPKGVRLAGVTLLPKAARERLKAASQLGNLGDPEYEAALEREINNVKYDYPEYFRAVPSERIK